MKKICFSLVMLLTFICSAQVADPNHCHESLLDKQGDSAVHRISTSHFDAGLNEYLDESSALNAVVKIMENKGCSTENLELISVCTPLKKKDRRTACLVESKKLFGYFTVVKDYMDTFYVIYNRWD